MIAAIGDFLRFNLGAGLLAGALAWLLVYAGIRVLRIQDGKLRLCLYSAPLIKSTLVILGIDVVTRWDGGFSTAWQARCEF